MKKLVFILAGLLLSGTTAIASTTTKADLDNNASRNFARGYGNSFIFVEQGIEFAVFPDGQFDFNVNAFGPDFSVGANFGNVNISFNTGFNYNPYVQYDDFGAVVQIENVPIYYDFYGRITQAGSVNIRYNNFGRIARVGGLFVHYNRFNRFDYCSGFINVFNRSYVYRPWHRFYAIPVIDYCVVYNRPYRQFYNPIRHTYYRPYRDNLRPRYNRSYNASRRNNVAQASRSDRYRQSATPRRGNAVAKAKPRISRGDQTVSRSKPRVSRLGKPETVTRGKPRVDRVRPNTRPNTSTVNRGKPKVSRVDNAVTKGKPRVDRPSSQRGKPEATINKRSTRNKVAQKRNNRSSKTFQNRSSRTSERSTVSTRSQSRKTTSKASRSSRSRKGL